MTLARALSSMDDVAAATSARALSRFDAFVERDRLSEALSGRMRSSAERSMRLGAARKVFEERLPLLREAVARLYAERLSDEKAAALRRFYARWAALAPAASGPSPTRIGPASALPRVGTTEEREARRAQTLIELDAFALAKEWGVSASMAASRRLAALDAEFER